MKKYIGLFIAGILISCSSSDPDPVPPEDLAPVASTYVLPANNAVCTGEEISETEIKVDFEWNDFQDDNDDNIQYTFTLTDVTNNQIITSQELSQTATSVTLEKGTTYSWNIKATDSADNTTTGQTWQFQTPFNAVTNHLPFPATLVTPTNGETVTTNEIQFTWQGNDPDDGETALLEYTLFVDSANPPIQEIANMLSAETHTETLTVGVYYWKVQSKDPAGNISNSEIRQLIVE